MEQEKTRDVYVCRGAKGSVRTARTMNDSAKRLGPRQLQRREVEQGSGAGVSRAATSERREVR